ncbi:hypothetical protein [Dysgonomonas sp. GY617]|uniref:hypothetical protein n=1 Tax=Dysgonomonas sp. GY617 TaxID=2780420 RepID=UPI0018847A57|nr:hypothetical protein [Dysgonomonas sp. GY617]MBF0576797.1 hypothetical protein [Dysgonomonas sp. GY617]
MIIYGTKSSKGKFIDTNCQCPFCGKENALAVLPFQKSFHVYWIPIIPTGKEFFVVCKACGHEAPDHYIGGITPEVKKQAKTSLFSFIGLFIILALAAFVFYSTTMRKGESSSKNDAVTILTNPKVGDVLEMKIKDNQYSVCKVASISEDSIYLQFSESIVSKKKDLKDLKKSFANEVESKDLIDGYKRTELFNLINKGVIIGGDQSKE